MWPVKSDPCVNGSHESQAMVNQLEQILNES